MEIWVLVACWNFSWSRYFGKSGHDQVESDVEWIMVAGGLFEFLKQTEEANFLAKLGCFRLSSIADYHQTEFHSCLPSD